MGLRLQGGAEAAAPSLQGGVEAAARSLQGGAEAAVMSLQGGAEAAVPYLLFIFCNEIDVLLLFLLTRAVVQEERQS